MSFASLGLSEVLTSAVAREGYETPTPIQQRAIPVVLEGRDVLAAAQTGTGKTAAFTLPMLQKLAEPGERRVAPRALVLTPTRELAAQIAESTATYGRELPVKHTVIFGGVGHQPQIDALKRGVDIVIATPGRLLEHVGDGHVDLSKIEFFVLDEADRMLDMGFIHDIRRVLKVLPQKRQNLLFSATFSEDIRKLAHTFLHEPAEIDIAPRNAAVDSVEQKVVFVEQKEKRQLLSHLIHGGGWKQVLVFARMKHGANRLCDFLNADGLPAAALHGNKSQSARTRALADFKAGRIRVLVATDIAARGIDIDQLPHVINFELPNVPEDYVHRIGRTGRAGNEGEALSLVAQDERAYLRDIQKLIRREIPVMAMPADFVPKALPPDPPRPPMQPRRGGQQRPQRQGNAPQGGGQSGHAQSAGGGGGQPQRSQTQHPRGPRPQGQGPQGQRPQGPRPQGQGQGGQGQGGQGQRGQQARGGDRPERGNELHPPAGRSNNKPKPQGAQNWRERRMQKIGIGYGRGPGYDPNVVDTRGDRPPPPDRDGNTINPRARDRERQPEFHPDDDNRGNLIGPASGNNGNARGPNSNGPRPNGPRPGGGRPPQRNRPRG